MRVVVSVVMKVVVGLRGVGGGGGGGSDGGGGGGHVCDSPPTHIFTLYLSQ